MNYLHAIINFDGFFELIPMVYSPMLAALLLGLLAGIIGPIIQARDMAFAVHGTSELSFAGASFALWLGSSITIGAIGGSLLGGIILAVMGLNAKNRNMVIGILLPFGLGLGILFLSLYHGRSSNKFGLLTGQIVSIDPGQLKAMLAVTAVVLISLFSFGKPILYASIDPETAQARGLPLTFLSIIFMMLLSLVVAMSVQLVGALLVLSLLITPTAAASKITASPTKIYGFSIAFAIVSAVGGILLSLGPGLPISPYVTSISFFIYLICYALGKSRSSRGWNQRLLKK